MIGVETSVVIDISKVPKIFVETIHRFSSSLRPSAGFSFTHADNFSGYALDKHGHFLCHHGVILAFFLHTWKVSLGFRALVSFEWHTVEEQNPVLVVAMNFYQFFTKFYNIQCLNLNWLSGFCPSAGNCWRLRFTCVFCHWSQCFVARVATDHFVRKSLPKVGQPTHLP